MKPSNNFGAFGSTTVELGRQRPLNRYGVASLVVIGMATTAWAPVVSASVTATKRDEVAWLVAAKHALRDPTWQCRPYGEPVKKVNLPGLGTVDNICVRSGSIVSFIQNKPTGNGGFASSGVIYSDSLMMPTNRPDSWVAHINGPGGGSSQQIPTVQVAIALLGAADTEPTTSLIRNRCSLDG